MGNYLGKQPLIYMPKKKTRQGGVPNAGDLIHSLGYITRANDWATSIASNNRSELHAKGILQTGAPRITDLRVKLAIGYSSTNYYFNTVRDEVYFFCPIYYYPESSSAAAFATYDITLPYVYFIDITELICYKLTTTRVQPRIMTHTSAHRNLVDTTPVWSDIGEKEGDHNVFAFPYNQNDYLSNSIDNALIEAGVSTNGWLVMSTSPISDGAFTSEFGVTSFVDLTY